VRDALVWSNPHAAILPSNLGAMVFAPVAGAGLLALAAGHDDHLSNFGIDLLLVTQATAVAGTLNQLIKFAVGRRRPFATAGLPNPDTRQGPADSNLSFYSGHTSLAFSLAASAGTVATLRRYRWSRVVWIAGGIVGAATGYLRIAADQHFLTDVLTGALVGTAVGVGVPALFHRPRSGADAAGVVRLAPTPNGAQLLYALTF
jgi:membrane-associated phospholipid phosphatase